MISVWFGNRAAEPSPDGSSRITPRPSISQMLNKSSMATPLGVSVPSLPNS